MDYTSFVIDGVESAINKNGGVRLAISQFREGGTSYIAPVKRENKKISERVYEERFERAYGFYRPYLQSVIYRYLDCGILRNGFARIRCGECGHEYLLAFSCKRRHFCPSCHQKRVVEFGEWVCGDVLKRVPHRHFAFSIPRILRRYFLYDRSLLSELGRCAWEALRVFFQEAVPQSDAMPGVITGIQQKCLLLAFKW